MKNKGNKFKRVTKSTLKIQVDAAIGDPEMPVPPRSSVEPHVPAYIGFVERISSGVIEGWAIDRLDLSRRPSVRAMVDGQVIGTGISDIYHEHVHKSGAGDGRYGFHIACNGMAIPLERISVVIDDPAHPFRLPLTQRAMAEMRASNTPAYIGLVERVTSRALEPARAAGVLPAITPEKETVVKLETSTIRADLEGVAMTTPKSQNQPKDPEYALSAADAFDEDLYCSTYWDVSMSGLSPVAHYIHVGAKEGRCPNVLFDTRMYCDRYPEVLGSGMDPLSYFLRVGALKGHHPHVLYDAAYVLKQLAKVCETTPVSAYLMALRGLLPMDINPHPLFDGSYYEALFKRRTGEGLPANTSAIKHYLTTGYRMGIDPHPLICENSYRDAVTGLHELSMSALRHYVEFGITERRSPHPFVQTSRAEHPDITGPGPFHNHEIPYYAALNRGRLKPVRSSTSVAAALAAWLNLEADKAIPQQSTPVISFVILNFNKAYLTLQTIASLALHTDMSDHEIVVLDNGSTADDFFVLLKFLPRNVRVVRLRANRYFGEGNNIAVEHARGDIICFMNNDLCFTDGWLDRLLTEYRAYAGIAAIGPLFKFPDGTLQEFGGNFSSCGQVIQRYKNLKNYDTRTLPETEEVQYSSAACLIMAKSLFTKLGGFDHRYEPVYYEDTDLCAKIGLAGASVRVVRDSVVYHAENATTSDRSVTGQMGSIHDIIPVNRSRFVGRWQQYLSRVEQGGRAENAVEFATRIFSPSFAREAEHVVSRASADHRPRLALYSPYPLIVGGGERYLFSVASAWAKQTLGEVCIVTPDHYSRLRILTMLRDLEIEEFRFHCLTIDQVSAKFDYSFVMGNEVMPPIAGLAKRNFYHCQFPFPHTHDQFARTFGYLADYEAVIVNSEFTRHHYQKMLGETNAAAALRIDVVYPPVSLPDTQPKTKDNGLVILSVGRFFVGGHTKGHAELIAAFKALHAKIPDAELHLVGGLQPGAEHRQYLVGLEDSARGLPIYFHINVEPWQLHELYWKAHFYWHGTGLQGRNLSPEKYEHFGISIVEAMGYGCVPFALDHAGPAEIIVNGVSGVLVQDVFDLVKQAMTFVENQNACYQIAENAVKRAQQYSKKIFEGNILRRLGVEA